MLPITMNTLRSWASLSLNRTLGDRSVPKAKCSQNSLKDYKRRLDHTPQRSKPPVENLGSASSSCAGFQIAGQLLPLRTRSRSLDPSRQTSCLFYNMTYCLGAE